MSTDTFDVDRISASTTIYELADAILAERDQWTRVDIRQELTTWAEGVRDVARAALHTEPIISEEYATLTRRRLMQISGSRRFLELLDEGRA